MEGYAIICLLIVFLPFLVSMRGYNPVWKFLSFLFCVFSLCGIFAFFVPGVLCWIVAWIFAGVSFGSRIHGPSVSQSSASSSPFSGPYSPVRVGVVLLVLAGFIAIYSWVNSSNSAAKLTSVKVENQNSMTVTGQDSASQGPVVTDVTAKELSAPPPPTTKTEAKRPKEVKQQKSNKPVALTPPTARADATR
jgi:hypothetical protein